jgi:hypothetical protein
MAVVVLGTGLWWRATRPPPGVSREVAGLIRDLQRRPAALQRVATSVATWIHPRAARHLPPLLRIERADLKRLEACHRLIALGPATRPAGTLLTRALSDPDPTISFYAFLALAHSTTPAAVVAQRARETWGSAAGPARFYAGLLTTEDERLRDFAWECLEAVGPEAAVAAGILRDVASEGDPPLRDRARQLLRRLGQEPPAARPGQQAAALERFN